MRAEDKRVAVRVLLSKWAPRIYQASIFPIFGGAADNCGICNQCAGQSSCVSDSSVRANTVVHIFHSDIVQKAAVIASPCAGVWIKDTNRSDLAAYGRALDLMRLNGLQKTTALRLIEGVEIQQGASDFSVNFLTVVPFFKVCIHNSTQCSIGEVLVRRLAVGTAAAKSACNLAVSRLHYVWKGK